MPHAETRPLIPYLLLALYALQYLPAPPLSTSTSKAFQRTLELVLVEGDVGDRH